MALRINWLKSLKQLFPNIWKMENLTLIKVELIVEISFKTFGQLKYTDENERLWIKEFVGDGWSKQIFLKQQKKIKFSVFVNNQFLRKGEYINLIMKMHDEVVDQKKIYLNGVDLFEGWFRLGY